MKKVCGKCHKGFGVFGDPDKAKCPHCARAAKSKRKNQLGPAIVSGIGYAMGSKLVESESDTLKKRNGFSFAGLFGKKKVSRKAAKPRRAQRGRKVAKRKVASRDVYNKAYRAHFGAARAKALKETSPARFGRGNPEGQHIPGLPPAYQRMYEHIVQSPGAKKHYGPRLKEVAARTVKKAAAAGILPNSFYRSNPAFFGYLITKKKNTAKTRSTPRKKIGQKRARARRRLAGKRLRHPSRVRRNQSAESLFKEFRGRAPRGQIVEAQGHGPSGKVIEVAELGKLREICLSGCPDAGKSGQHRIGPKHLVFGNARLLADTGKNLHIAGVRYQPKASGDYGLINEVVYRADKPHIEKGKFDYGHKFGEEGGSRPRYVIDQEGYPAIKGGSYGITADGILD